MMAEETENEVAIRRKNSEICIFKITGRCVNRGEHICKGRPEE